MSNKEPDLTQAAGQSDVDARAEKRSSVLLRLLQSRSSGPIRDQELREEFQRLYDLLKRIDELAEDELRHDAITAAQEPAEELEPEPTPPPAPQPPIRPAWQPEFAPEPEPELIPFDPAELEAFESFEPHFAGVDEASENAGGDEYPDLGEAPEWMHDPVSQPQPVTEPEPEPDNGATAGESGADEHLQRWWVSFNGDVSLDRLARLRKTLSGSPFTIESRFDEISDGLIVLRVVTERHLTMEQVDWIVKQVMQGVGLDSNAAIISRN